MLMSHGARCSGARRCRAPAGNFTHPRRRHGVVLACGGFPHDVEAHRARPIRTCGAAARHMCRPCPPSNTGDGARHGRIRGRQGRDPLCRRGAWMPVSKVPAQQGGTHTACSRTCSTATSPASSASHGTGKRFTNESNSYHDVGAAMIGPAPCAAEVRHRDRHVADLRPAPPSAKYGLGYAKPAPMPLWPLRQERLPGQGQHTGRAGAQRRASTPPALEATVRRATTSARRAARMRSLRPRRQRFQPLPGRPCAAAQPLRGADREGTVLRAQGRDGRPGQLRRQSSTSVVGRVLDGAIGSPSPGSTRWATTAPA